MSKKRIYEIQDWDNLHFELNDNLLLTCFQLDTINHVNDPKQSDVLTVKAFIALNDILITAHYCLLEGCRFDHKTNRDEPRSQYIMNLHNLKSAVVWYTSAIDYFLQTIYWGFEFYSPINDDKSFLDNLKQCKVSDGGEPSDFMKRFKTLADENTEAKKVYKSYNRINNNIDRMVLVRKLANAMKHHWGFELEETYINPKTHYHGKISFSPDAPPIDRRNIEEFIKHICQYGNSQSDYIPEKQTIKYKELISRLVNLHIELTNFQEELFRALGFGNGSIERKFTAKSRTDM